MTDHPEYTSSRPPSCPRNQDHLTGSYFNYHVHLRFLSRLTIGQPPSIALTHLIARTVCTVRMVLQNLSRRRS